MFPAGMIILWSGAIVNIPSGWIICDGENGTPNLDGKFIIGAGDEYAVDETGGANSHEHTFTGDGHQHFIGAGLQIAAGTAFGEISAAAPVTGTTDSASNIPKYHALAYIMKT